jgi:hypothetical protein
MSDLHLADEVMNAAKKVSTQESIDVEVLCADGSRNLYVKGEDVTPVWWAAPMPQMEHGQSPSHLDMTPTKVRLGHWHKEAEEFIPSRSMSVSGFLDLAKP